MFLYIGCVRGELRRGGAVREFVSLPLLGPLPISVFLAVAPAVVLCVYAYLHLYVGELLRRLRTFDRLPDLDPTPPITRDQLL
ncbi:MAG: hypothetical protein O7C98_03235 [Planctomycetota bacterium]|nr:hypothetical protein [Planctomycetota bacterium]